MLFRSDLLNLDARELIDLGAISYFSVDNTQASIEDIVVNVYDEDDYVYDLSMENNIAIVWEASFTKAFDFEPLGLGFTLKYLRGLSYYNLKPTQDPYFQTNFTDITSKNTYIMKQNSGGEGFAVDLGLRTKPTDSGWTFGFSVINFFLKFSFVASYNY